MFVLVTNITCNRMHEVVAQMQSWTSFSCALCYILHMLKSLHHPVGPYSFFREKTKQFSQFTSGYTTKFHSRSIGSCQPTEELLAVKAVEDISSTIKYTAIGLHPHVV